MERVVLMLSGVLGAAAVGLGAFGAHGLERLLAETPDAVKRMGWWETAAHYHLIHAVALAVVGILLTRSDALAGRVASTSFVGGILVFSGTLYAMALGGPRWLGAITPIGGVLLIVGWVAFAVAASRL